MADLELVEELNLGLGVRFQVLGAGYPPPRIILEIEERVYRRGRGNVVW